MNGKTSFYDFYRAHNIHFVLWTAMFLGDYETAILYSKMIKELINEQFLVIYGFYAEVFVNSELHVMIRFGKWKEIL